MSTQVGAVGEGLATVGAGERLLSGVGPHVALQEPGPAEGLAAHLALVLQVMSEHVHGKGWHRHVHFVAGGALPGLLAVQTTVSLLVSAQVGRGGVGLAALAAHVAPPGLPFGRAAVCRARPLAAVRLVASLARMPLAGSPAGASVGDEESVDGACFQVGAAAVRFCGGAGGRAVRMLHVMVGELFPSAAAWGAKRT